MHASRLVAVLLPLTLAACASPTPPPKLAVPAVDLQAMRQDSTFPQPPQLAPAVGFWRRVYAEWGRGQVAVHDDRYLDLVYQVATLPGPLSDSYSEEQRAYVRSLRESWQYRLAELERKQRYNLPLTAEEQALAGRIAAVGGPQALFGASERVRTQRGMRERFKRGVEISGRYDAVFRQIFREHGLPEDLAFLPHVESSFQPHARSSADAVGMWQFTLGAARRYMNLNAAVDERLDPVAAARGAARYLADAHASLGSWPLALTSYNHGVGGMKRAREQFGDDFARIVAEYDGRYFGFASRNFYAEFLAAREIARDPQRFFPEGVRLEPPLSLDRVVLQNPVPSRALAGHYRLDLGTLAALNPAWTPAAASGRLPLPAGTEVWLPSGTLARLGSGSGAGSLAMSELRRASATIGAGSAQ
ncbi:MAG TPA: lytic transglycosylase domain-containing protein [Candidatus Competibacteraceae bacterium]|nr:lytic transglycosylase domain-containing protein [Candidatus Competibacteraceae bacterium]